MLTSYIGCWCHRDLLTTLCAPSYPFLTSLSSLNETQRRLTNPGKIRNISPSNTKFGVSFMSHKTPSPATNPVIQPLVVPTNFKWSLTDYEYYSFTEKKQTFCLKTHAVKGKNTPRKLANEYSIFLGDGAVVEPVVPHVQKGSSNVSVNNTFLILYQEGKTNRWIERS